jgi:Leucine-rich repeat (LRR) protein
MLDISNNHFTELWSLIPFTKLKILIADHNALPSSVQLPSLPSLETLWVNYNRITNLSLFMTHLAAKVPGLRHLSLLGNNAEPSSINHGTLEQYKDYRSAIHEGD